MFLQGPASTLIEDVFHGIARDVKDLSPEGEVPVDGLKGD